jgi:hypothetical protein
VLSEEKQIFGTLGEWILGEPNGPSMIVLHVQNTPAASSAA